MYIFFASQMVGHDSLLPHGYCFLWQSNLLWLHVVSDSIIALAYFTIPIALNYLVKKREDLSFGWMVVLFGVFILFCGFTHILNIWNIWNPDYWVSGLIKSMTAIASIATAILLWRLIPAALNLPSHDQLIQANSDLEYEAQLRRKTMEELKIKEQELLKYSHAVSYSASMVMITDQEGIIEHCNPAFCNVTGYTLEELIGTKPNILRSGHTDQKVYDQLWSSISSGKEWQGEFLERTKSGELVWCLQSISPVLNDYGQITNYVSVSQDISKQKDSEQLIKHMAYYDPLTDLPNRSLFSERLDQALINGQRHKTQIALMYLDLDRFKNINDTLGHLVGDKLLQHVSQRLKKTLRATDTVARLGGDEFAIIIPDFTNSYAVHDCAKKIIRQFQEPIEFDELSLHVGCSIGVSLYPKDAETSEQLIRNADMAMYQAKNNGRNHYFFFTSHVDEHLNETVKLENDLHHCITRKELFLVYQPIISNTEKKITAFEALIRWQHPELGLIPPDKFIGIAEDTGLIDEIGRWIMDTACRDMNTLKQNGYQDFTFSINLSPRQFSNPALLDEIQLTLNIHKIQPEKISLELTESTVMADPEHAIKTLFKLRNLGIRIAIDDFGTGHSSLSFLKRFPLDVLKIDRAFVKDLGQNKQDEAILKAIVELAQCLDLKIIAEGVENETQLNFLSSTGCEYFQGYYFSRPIKREEIDKMLSQMVVA